jgi:hypothetical protein
VTSRLGLADATGGGHFAAVTYGGVGGYGVQAGGGSTTAGAIAISSRCAPSSSKPVEIDACNSSTLPPRDE